MAVNYTLSSDRELYHYLSMPEHRERAFEEIYRRYGQRIYAYCRKILFNTQDAEDAFQSTFLKFLSSVSPDREMTNLPAYLLTIARTTCMDMFAQRHEHAELVEDFHGRPDQTVEANEINELIEMALHLLPAQWREAVIMAALRQHELRGNRIRIRRSRDNGAELALPRQATLARNPSAVLRRTSCRTPRVTPMEQLSHRDMIDLFLDGQLPAETRSVFFAALAASEELQAELHRAVVIHAAAHRHAQTLQPPPALTASILAAAATPQVPASRTRSGWLHAKALRTIALTAAATVIGFFIGRLSGPLPSTTKLAMQSEHAATGNAVAVQHTTTQAIPTSQNTQTAHTITAQPKNTSPIALRTPSVDEDIAPIPNDALTAAAVMPLPTPALPIDFSPASPQPNATPSGSYARATLCTTAAASRCGGARGRIYPEHPANNAACPSPATIAFAAEQLATQQHAHRSRVP